MRTKWERSVLAAEPNSKGRRNTLMRMPKEFRLPPARRRRRKGRKEASIEESCRLIAKGMGWLSRKMNGMGFRDWPDRLFIPTRGPGRRRPFWVEFKRMGEEPTPAQCLRIEDLRSRGERVYVCDNVPGFKGIIKAEH